ncbi:transcription factor ORG3-like [Selaginella moellendorffii]|uniref:transcription factor ORG3-like n=1 Tax=Selaginella moellendorffii TaxID=88036 RepID=UPI000D1C96DC|nr:transcription factor ORG3-like [Selaginella moellendorffii]|eukprot:XP_024528414.1 transcription factor ORG3-like [Selaginella moellendorffii]
MASRCFHPSVYLDGCSEFSAPGPCEYTAPKLQIELEQEERIPLSSLIVAAGIEKRELAMDNTFFQTESWQPAQFAFGSSNPLSVNLDSLDARNQGSSSVFQAMTIGKEADLRIPGYNTLKGQQQLTTRPSISSCRSQVLEKALGVQQKWPGKRPLAQRESHIWSERERRKGMNRLFCILRSLLPEPSSKTDKSTVVGEIIKYISFLRLSIEELTKKKSDILQRAARVSQSSSGDSGAIIVNQRSQETVPSFQSVVFVSTPLVALHVCRDNVFLNMTCSRRASLFVNILWAMRQHQLILLNATVSAHGSQIIYCIHSKAKDINHFARESLHSALLTIAQPLPNVY